MTDELALKPVVWVGSSRKDLRRFSDPVQREVGYAIYVAQRGGKHRDAKVLTGFGGAGVLEVVEDFRGDTFRAVYALKFRIAFMYCMRFRRNRRADVRRRAETWNSSSSGCAKLNR